jgi:hypothetical protein
MVYFSVNYFDNTINLKRVKIKMAQKIENMKKETYAHSKLIMANNGSKEMLTKFTICEIRIKKTF